VVGAIIQARMGSTRLPGKVLADLAGKPLLWHIVQRLKRSEEVDSVIVATTFQPEDSAIENFCQEEGIPCFRGSEEDVLNRYIMSAETHGVDTVVRVCSDSPLVDPFSVDKMIQLYRKENADLVTANPERTSLLDGFEVTSLSFLKLLESKATKRYHREHVTYLAKEDPSLGKLLFYDPPKELAHRDIRITVDTEKDLQFIREVYKWLYEESQIIDIRKIDKLPFYIFRINREVQQKPPHIKGMRIHVVADQVDDKLKDFRNLVENTSAIKVEFLPGDPENKREEEIYFKSIS
jgi:spore coat polysaccharide biosynthesis protein SpsF (cytidylyltransferase family)